MAERLKAHPSGDKRQKYPWDLWADGDTWQLARGVDYTVSDAGFKAAAYYHANKIQRRVRTTTTSVGVAITFDPLPPVMKKKFRKLKRKSGKE